MAIQSLASDSAVAPDYLWRNGNLVPWGEATVHVNAVGHASVAAVFEGIKAYWNPEREQLFVFRLEDHMRRLIESARIARLKLAFSVRDLSTATIELLRRNGERRDVYIRPWTFVEGLVREQIAPADSSTETVIDSWPFETAMLRERGCTACISSWRRIGETTMPPRVKAFANYHNGRFAAMEARASGYDWPILLNDRGQVTEGPGACVGLVRDGVLVTPSLHSGVLESLTRDSLLRLATERLDLTVVERAVDRSELYLAEELFFMGTGWEILPILAIDGLPVGTGAMGPVARSLDRAYHDVVRGNDADYADWLRSVW